jgi:hypothetical protein
MTKVGFSRFESEDTVKKRIITNFLIWANIRGYILKPVPEGYVNYEDYLEAYLEDRKGNSKSE